jgi:pimeloyl-ACP methyl ester carboxylesterase
LLRRVLILGLAAAILLVAALAGAAYVLSRPSPMAIGAAPADLGPSEQVTIRSASGSDLRGWFVPGEAGQGALLLLHGVNANRTQMLGRIRLLHRAGYAVLAIDLQAHGESPGIRITFGAAEGEDAEAAVAYLRARLPGERIGVIGMSLGGAAALLAPRPLAVDALVLESVFPDIASAVADRLETRFGPPGRWITPLFLRVASIELGIDPAALRPIDRIGGVSAPVFVLGGTADRSTTIDETRALFAAAHAPKTLWEVAGAGHVDLQRFAGAEYDRRILAFLAATLRPAAAP